MSDLPNNRRYTKTHEWALKAEDNLVTIGITDHAQHKLGDIVFIELPQIGTQVAQGQECSVVESVKAASDIYAPVGGEIVAVNETLNSQPEIVNESPFDSGWLFKIKLSNQQEYDALLDAAYYENLIQEEA